MMKAKPEDVNAVRLVPTTLMIQTCALCAYSASARSEASVADAIHDHTIAVHINRYVGQPQ